MGRNELFCSFVEGYMLGACRGLGGVCRLDVDMVVIVFLL